MTSWNLGLEKCGTPYPHFDFLQHLLWATCTVGMPAMRPEKIYSWIVVKNPTLTPGASGWSRHLSAQWVSRYWIISSAPDSPSFAMTSALHSQSLISDSMRPVFEVMLQYTLDFFQSSLAKTNSSKRSVKACESPRWRYPGHIWSYNLLVHCVDKHVLARYLSAPSLLPLFHQDLWFELVSFWHCLRSTMFSRNLILYFEGFWKV